MYKIVLAVFILLVTISKTYSYDGGHDSLLFDGNYQSSFDSSIFRSECFWKVVIVKGVVGGTVFASKKTNNTKIRMLPKLIPSPFMPKISYQKYLFLISKSYL